MFAWKNNRFLFLISFIGLVLFLMPSFPVFAQTEGAEQQTEPDVSGVVSDLNALNKFGSNSPQTLIGNLIKTGMGVIGSIALIMFIYAGLTWMLSRGEDKQKTALKIMFWTSIGVIAMLSSYAIVTFVFEAFQ